MRLRNGLILTQPLSFYQCFGEKGACFGLLCPCSGGFVVRQRDSVCLDPNVWRSFVYSDIVMPRALGGVRVFPSVVRLHL